MSRKSLLLIAAAVISIPALTSSNAFAKGSAAGHAAMPVSRPHVSTLKPAVKIAAPRVASSGTARQVASSHRSGLIDPKELNKAIKDITGYANPTSVGKTIGDEVKGVTGNASASGPFASAIQKVREAAEKAAADARAKAAHDAAIAHAKLQTPADPGYKVGSQIPVPPPPAPAPKGTPDGGRGPHFPAPGGAVVMGSGVSIDPAVVQPGPVVANSTIAASSPVATSRVVAATTDGATTPRPNPCNCLVKERLQDGSVLFMDICTKELARSVPTNETATPREAQ